MRRMRSFMRHLPRPAATQASASRSSASMIAVRRAACAIASNLGRPASSSSRSRAASETGVSVGSGISTRRARVDRDTRRCASGDRRRPPGTARARRHACGRELRDGQRARAADDEVGPAIRTRHVVDEGARRRRRARGCGRRRVRLRRDRVRRSGAARRAAASPGSSAIAAGTTAFSARGALAAAEYEQPCAALAPRVSLLG